MNLKEKQAEMVAAVKDAQTLLDDVKYAESCDNETDFKINVEDAIDQAESVLRVLKALIEGRVPV